ncbi:YciI family protein [Yoonia sp. 208BN28-4]|uniref:YciI family protein n=1 Tax=Yoonia sp. 208BN28-4 TaxID=3126505 RepID=UPI0030A6DA10
MQYICLIYSNEGSEPPAGTPEFASYMQGYGTFTQSCIKDTSLVHGDALQPIATATTVKVRDGKTITTDGPFAETKEQLGGYYLLDCEDLDAAIAKAAQIPTAKFGRIEIRPVVVWDD